MQTTEILVDLQKIQFTFIPFSDFLLSEIWIEGNEKDFYAGEMVICLN